MPEFEDDLPDNVALSDNLMPFLTKNVSRVYGYLYVTEYDNYGDVQWETAIESAKCTKKGVIGGDHMRVATATHYVELLSTYPCRVAFCADGEDLSQAESHAFPLPPDTPVQRLVPMNTAMTIVTFPGY